MKNGSILKLILGASAITLGLSAFGLANVKPVAQVDAVTSSSSASSSILGVGSTLYAFVPDSWIASGRFLTFKFTGSGTALSSGSGTRTEGYSTQTDTSIAHRTDATFGDIYQLALVSGFSHVFSGIVPAIPSGYSSFNWTRAQVCSYPSSLATGTSTWHNTFTASTAVAAPSGNLISVNADAPVSKALSSTYFGSRAFVSDTEKVNEWAYKVLKTYATVCDSGKTYARNDQAGAQLYYQKGWTYQTQSIGDASDWNALTSKALFTNVVASATSSSYYARFASMYDYILSKYGYYSATNTSAYLANYANRTIPSFVSGSSIVMPTASDSSSTLVLGGLSAVAVIAAGGYFFVRKKKID